MRPTLQALQTLQSLQSLSSLQIQQSLLQTTSCPICITPINNDTNQFNASLNNISCITNHNSQLFLKQKYNRRGPFLIAAPLSTLGYWQREFRSWTDLNVIVYHGSQASRERIVAEEFEWLWTDSSHPRAKNAKELKDQINVHHLHLDHQKQRIYIQVKCLIIH